MLTSIHQPSEIAAPPDDIQEIPENSVSFRAIHTRGNYRGIEGWKIREVIIALFATLLIITAAWAIHDPSSLSKWVHLDISALPAPVYKCMLATGVLLFFRTAIFRPLLANSIYHAIYPLKGWKYPGYCSLWPLAPYYNSMQHRDLSVDCEEWLGKSANTLNSFEQEIHRQKTTLSRYQDDGVWERGLYLGSVDSLGRRMGGLFSDPEEANTREYSAPWIEGYRGVAGKENNDKVLLIRMESIEATKHWSFVAACKRYLEQGYNVVLYAFKAATPQAAENYFVGSIKERLMRDIEYYANHAWHQRPAFKPVYDDPKAIDPDWHPDPKWASSPNPSRPLNIMKNGYQQEVRTLHTLTGIPIHSRFLQGKDSKEHSGEIVILSCGNTHLYHQEYDLQTLTTHFIDKGYSIMLYHPPGYGFTPGPRSPNHDFLALETVIQYVMIQKQIPEEHISLMGYSIGTGATLEMATKYKLKSVSIVGGFSSMSDTAVQLTRNDWKSRGYPTVGKCLGVITRFFFSGVIDDYYGYDNVKGIKNAITQDITINEGDEDPYLCDLHEPDMAVRRTTSQGEKMKKAWMTRFKNFERTNQGNSHLDIFHQEGQRLRFRRHTGGHSSPTPADFQPT